MTRSEAKRHLNLQKWSEPLVFCTFWLRNVLRATKSCTFSRSEPPKVARTCGVLYILTSKCASRHNGVHFFDISTSKSGPKLVCSVHFDFEMCFAPQRRALFRHRNFQKWSDNGVFCTFWLGNVLRATTACTFSTSQLPKVVRSWGVLYILTCKCASRHNGVQFFISHLASWLRTRRSSEPTFRPSGATNHWKNTVFRDFPTFLRICIFFLLTLSLLLFFLLIFLFSLPLPCSAFHLSILSEVWLLNFLRKFGGACSNFYKENDPKGQGLTVFFAFGMILIHSQVWGAHWSFVFFFTFVLGLRPFVSLPGVKSTTVRSCFAPYDLELGAEDWLSTSWRDAYLPQSKKFRLPWERFEPEPTWISEVSSFWCSPAGCFNCSCCHLAFPSPGISSHDDSWHVHGHLSFGSTYNGRGCTGLQVKPPLLFLSS